MNALKKEILQIATGLLLREIPLPTNCSVSTIGGLKTAIASVLQERKGRIPLYPTPATLTGEDAEIFLEVVWDLLCARIITPKDCLNGFNEKGLNGIRLHSDAEDNWKKFKVVVGISD
jgi:hypothetical protein